MSRGQGLTAVVLLTVLMAGAAVAALALLRTVRPLVVPHDDRTAMFGHRTRAALEREKMLTLRAIKELEFDRAMGKLSEGDWAEMSTRLRARAARLIRQLDAGGGYRVQIEQEVARRLGETAISSKGSAQPIVPVAPICHACGIANESDARFCKQCGTKLEPLQ
jgi:hypothetical protein